MGRTLVLLGMVVTAAGCGTLPDGHRWAEDATLVPSLERVGRAALRATLDPLTWAPAVGAGVFTIDRFDRKVSDWASERTPIFGSQRNAQDWSDILLGTAGGTTALSFVLTPSGEESGEWLLDKSKGLAVEGTALVVTAGATEGLKKAVRRERPASSNNTSFPSGHASEAAVFATLTARNLESIEMSDAARLALSTGSYTVAAAVAWARVEGAQHYPSDVLAGFALGHFFGVFFHDAFLGLPEKSVIPLVEVSPVQGGAFVEVGWSF